MSGPLSFTELSALLGPRIESALAARIDALECCPPRLLEAMRYSLLAPGKRLRPMLVLLAAEACGGSTEAAMPAACAVEMVHAYSLIHDDLPAMDNDDLRRGRPTCHKAFDEATAILAGDGLLTLAFEVLAREITPAAAAVECSAALARAAGACNMVGGQMDDIQAEGVGADGAGRSPDSTLSFLESIHNRKTGAMICVSLGLGAIVSGAGPDQRHALEQFGRRLGLAFQIADDLLDVTGTSSILGKQAQKDADRGKLTFPSLLGLDSSTQYAEQLISEACQTIEPFGPRANGLMTLARYVIQRDR